LIFLFKWVPTTDTRPTSSTPTVWFAKQEVTNACATQAILSILLDTKLDLGAELTTFKEQTMEFTPQLKGLAIGNHMLIKETHNSFARQEPFAFDNEKPSSGKQEDAYHFISYIPVDGRLYELDGLKAGPIDLGECTGENWVSVVTPIITERMKSCNESGISFVLLGVIKNRINVFNEKISEYNEEKANLESKLQSMGDMITDEASQVQKELELIKDKIDATLGFIEGEKLKRSAWEAENIRRRHNYIPFLFNLFKSLAEKDLLLPLIERAKEKQRLKNEKK